MVGQGEIYFTVTEEGKHKYSIHGINNQPGWIFESSKGVFLLKLTFPPRSCDWRDSYRFGANNFQKYLFPAL